MGGPRVKSDEERKQRRLENQRRYYRRSVVRKRQIALMRNHAELEEECDADSQAQLRNRNKSVVTSTIPKSPPRRIPTINPYSYPSDSTSPSDSNSPEDGFNSDHQLSDEEPLSDTDDSSSEMTTSMSDGEVEDRKLFLIPTTWNFDTVQDKEAFTKHLRRYRDEFDGLLQTDVECFKTLLKKKQEELPEAWTAVEARKFVACQVIRVEWLFQETGIKGWDGLLSRLINTLVAEYHRSSILASVHQRQMDHLKAGLQSGELEVQRKAFKNWCSVALFGYV